MGRMTSAPDSRAVPAGPARANDYDSFAEAYVEMVSGTDVVGLKGVGDQLEAWRRPRPTFRCSVPVVQVTSGWCPDRLEEGDQLIGDGRGGEHRGEVPESRQFADLRVGDVAGDVLRCVGEPGGEAGPLAL